MPDGGTAAEDGAIIHVGGLMHLWTIHWALPSLRTGYEQPPLTGGVNRGEA
jgi:hypothetical protein